MHWRAGSSGRERQGPNRFQEGERKVDRWTARHRCVEVLFDDAQAFRNVNTPADLQHLRGDAAR